MTAMSGWEGSVTCMLDTSATTAQPAWPRAEQITLWWVDSRGSDQTDDFPLAFRDAHLVFRAQGSRDRREAEAASATCDLAFATCWSWAASWISDAEEHQDVIAPRYKFDSAVLVARARVLGRYRFASLIAAASDRWPSDVIDVAARLGMHTAEATAMAGDAEALEAAREAARILGALAREDDR